MNPHRKVPAVVVVTIDLDDGEACAPTERAPPYFEEAASSSSFDALGCDGTPHGSSSAGPP